MYRLGISVFSLGLALVTAVAGCASEEDTAEVGSAELALADGPAVWTDKADYAPLETAYLGGDGWGADEDVLLTIECTCGCIDEMSVTADADGVFGDAPYAITEEHLGATCNVTAVGQVSGLEATTTFTDGNVKVDAAPAGTSFQLSYKVWNKVGCVGVVGKQGTETVVAGTNTSFTQAVKETESISLSAASISVQGGAFINWTSVGNLPGTPTAAATLCVNGFQTGHNDYIANYVAARTNRNPVVTCKNVSGTTEPATCSLVGSVVASTSDPDGDTVTCTESPAGPYKIGTTSVAVSCTDGHLGTASCSATVTLTDDDAPQVSCPAGQTAECTSPAGASVAFGASATDNCSAVAASCAGSGSTFPIGATSTSCSATDASGNSGSCTLSVRVVDTTAPSIACPAPSTAECTGDHAATLDPGNATGSDLCGGVAVSDPGAGSYPLGTTPVAYTGTDDAGLTRTCTTSVKVTDTTPPSIACPEAQVAECTGDHLATVDPGDATGHDACGGVKVSDPGSGPYPLGTTTVGYVATDDVGLKDSCTTSVTVQDTTAPSIECPDAITAECTGAGAATVDVAAGTASDVCGSATVSDPAEASYPLGTTTVAEVATDEAGNKNSCTSTVSVRDTTPPRITCPLPTAAECTGDHVALVDPGDASASDICGGVTVSDPGTGTYPLGTTTVGYAATDGAKLSATCTARVTVMDTTAPSISCPAAVTTECTGDRAATVDVSAATTSDVCGGATASDPSETSYPVGTTQVTQSTTDDVGLSASCTSEVTVVDTTAPSIECPAAVTAECTAAGAATVDVAAGTASDACGDTTVTDPAATSYPLGTTTVAETATDAAGLTGACTTTVTVIDATAPTFTSIPATQTVLGSCSGAPVTFVKPAAADGCQDAVVTCSPVAGNSFGANTVSCRAVDPSGNLATTTITVNVIQPLRIAFLAPLADDNVADDIASDADVANVFQVKSTIPHQLALYSCSGADVTTSVSVTVSLTVTLKDGSGVGSDTNVLTAYTGVGDAGGVMVLTDGKYKYNLKTTGYKTGTAASSLYFDSVASVRYTSSPGITAGQEDVRLESK
jgi:hypothetical protein